jgi:hypothetical protein
VEPKEIFMEPRETKSFNVYVPVEWGKGVLCGFRYQPIRIGTAAGSGLSVGIEYTAGMLFGVNFGMPEDPQVTFTAVQKDDHVETSVHNDSPWVLQCAVEFNMTGEGNALSFVVGPHNVRTISFSGVHSVAVLDIKGLGKRLGVKLGTRTSESLRNTGMDALVEQRIPEHESAVIK